AGRDDRPCAFAPVAAAGRGAPGDVLRHVPHAALAGECEPGAPAHRDRLHRGRAPRPPPPRRTGDAGPLGRHRADRGRRGPGLTHLTRARAALAVAALAVTLAVPLVFEGLGLAPFDDPGEGMHAEISREFLRSRDPFALTLGGVRYVDKPPLLYTLLAGALALAGPSETTARAVPALSALAAIAATACLALGLAWWPAVERRTPGFVWYTVIDNHLLNVARVRQFPDEDVPLSVTQFLAVALLGATPWILSAGAALWALVRQRAWRDPRETAWVALGLWAVGGLAITALSPFRLPHYGLPAYF